MPSLDLSLESVFSHGVNSFASLLTKSPVKKIISEFWELISLTVFSKSSKLVIFPAWISLICVNWYPSNELGRSSKKRVYLENVRPPRLPLIGKERKKVIQIIESSLKNRPDLSKYNY